MSAKPDELTELAKPFEDETLSEAEFQRFKQLAKQVRDDKHFAAILNTVPFHRRRALYDMIKPYLPFKAASFLVYKFH